MPSIRESPHKHTQHAYRCKQRKLKVACPGGDANAPTGCSQGLRFGCRTRNLGPQSVVGAHCTPKLVMRPPYTSKKRVDVASYKHCELRRPAPPRPASSVASAGPLEMLPPKYALRHSRKQGDSPMGLGGGDSGCRQAASSATWPSSCPVHLRKALPSDHRRRRSYANFQLNKVTASR